MKPFFECILNSEYFKILKIQGISGTQITEHKVSMNALLYVKEGFVNFKMGSKETPLYMDEFYEIPKDEFHEVIFNDTVELLLIMPQEANMKFKES